MLRIWYIVFYCILSNYYYPIVMAIIGPCIFGFKACCRSVIVIDETHPKGKYNSIIFVATTIDGNKQIFPLAYGFGDEENDRSWTWFLEQLDNVIGSL